jgi:sigma-E factor negative regulatory protein RseA
MSEERHNERDSQLSAMFDGELPGAECELLARRLTRDETLRASWSRYSMIGAALRAERGVALHDRVAWRVQSAITSEVVYGDGSIELTAISRAMGVVSANTATSSRGDRWLRFGRPVAGLSIAAGVAAMSIFMLRSQEIPEATLASNAVPQSIVLAPETVGTTVAMNNAPAAAVKPAHLSNGEPDRYVTPAPSSQQNMAPNARLANYVVAHSEYSGPLSRRMALLGLVSAENLGDMPDVTEAAPPPAAEPKNAH